MNTLVNNGLLTSMGAVGNCYDKIFAECVMGTLKGEYGLDSPFVSINQVATIVEEVVGLYNINRPHSSLGMATP